MPHFPLLALFDKCISIIVVSRIPVDQQGTLSVLELLASFAKCISNIAVPRIPVDQESILSDLLLLAYITILPWVSTN